MDSSGLIQQLRGVPYAQRWELLKPTIEQLYIRESKKLAEVITIIQARYGFTALEAQYKYQIKKWKKNKSTPNQKKDKICRIVKHRAREGKASIIEQKTKDLDIKNLQRYVKGLEAKSKKAIMLQPAALGTSASTCFPMMNTINFGNRIFMNWNMPYGVFRLPASRVTDQPSPMSDIQVTTPSSNQDPSSPMALTIAEISAMDRAQLFVEGKHDELLQSMGKEQKVVMSTWMYQFWFFAFTTAKNWGQGPKDWTADLLGFNNSYQPGTITSPSPNIPQNIDTPTSYTIPRTDDFGDLGALKPTSLCQWSIHVRTQDYEAVLSPPGSSPQTDDVEDERPWPGGCGSDEFTQKLCDNIESNQFSNLKSKDLPIGMKQIADAARRSPKELFKESFGFSIMSRNKELLKAHLERMYTEKIDLNDVRPYHLAASYLDGSKSCCDIFQELCGDFAYKFNVNDLGHTVLDQLMITILKSHSSCLPNVLDDAFSQSKRFEGDEVDICGRWDADSDCTRQRLASGIASIPFEWKHMFCHTSVKVICHCIGWIFAPSRGTPRNIESGLLVKRCLQCGLKLQLLPLHTLMMIAHHLSLSGCEGETMFGIVACLLCLLSNGCDPTLKATISFDLLTGVDEDNTCSHQPMNPFELGEQIVASFQHRWSKNVTIGWRVVLQVLKHSIQERHDMDLDDCNSTENNRGGEDLEPSLDRNERDASDEEGSNSIDSDSLFRCECDGGHDNYFGQSRILAPLWAAVQTELLTYRRQQESDPWISEYFDMEALYHGIAIHGVVAIALVQNDMVKPFCHCGIFETALPGCATIDDATTHYFSNLDDWERSTFLDFDDEERDEKWWIF